MAQTAGSNKFEKWELPETMATLVTKQNANLEKIDTSLSKVTSQAGLASMLAIQPNTWTEVAVTFPKAFASIPSVVVSHAGVSLENLNIHTTNISTTGFTIKVKTTSSGNVFVHWIAMLRS